MIEKVSWIRRQINPKSLVKTMVVGGLIGLVFISLFVFSVKTPNPNWGKYWTIRPLVIVPIAGAFGSLFFYALSFPRSKSIWLKIIAGIFSLIAFLITLWVGVILGLDGTLWD